MSDTIIDAILAELKIELRRRHEALAELRAELAAEKERAGDTRLQLAFALESCEAWANDYAELQAKLAAAIRASNAAPPHVEPSAAESEDDYWQGWHACLSHLTRSNIPQARMVELARKVSAAEQDWGFVAIAQGWFSGRPDQNGPSR